MARPQARSSQQQPGRSLRQRPAGHRMTGHRQDRPPASRRRLGESVALLVWLAMMLVWLVAWVLGVWWVLPVVTQLELTVDLIGGVFWLVTGAIAWMVAFVMGYRRYWAT